MYSAVSIPGGRPFIRMHDRPGKFLIFFNGIRHDQIKNWESKTGTLSSEYGHLCKSRQFSSMEFGQCVAALENRNFVVRVWSLMLTEQ
jgi:hypothetical protein